MPHCISFCFASHWLNNSLELPGSIREQVRKKSNENWDYFRQSIELFLIAKHILEDEVVIFKKQKTELFTEV